MADTRTKRDYVPGKGWVDRDSAKVEKVDDPDTLSQDEVEAEGGLGALAKKRRKSSAGSQGDALKARPTPRATPTATPRPRGGY